MRIAIPLCLLLLFIVIASTGFYLIEDEFSWLDSVYMAVITVSTVGFKEVGMLSQLGRVWTIFVIAGGVLLGAVVLSLVVAMVVQGQIRGIFGRRQLENKIKNLTGHIIVCGYGRMGQLIENELTSAGKRVVVIDSDPAQTAKAESADVLYVLGDAQEEGVLASAGIDSASVLIATLTSDAQNVFVTLAARQGRSDLTILARAQQPASTAKFKIAGATRVIYPQLLGALRMADVVLRPAVVDFVEMAHKGVDLEMDQLQLSAGSPLVGATLAELELPRRTGAHIVAIRKADGQAVYHPTPEMTFSPGDTIILVGKRGCAAAVEQLQTT